MLVTGIGGGGGGGGGGGIGRVCGGMLACVIIASLLHSHESHKYSFLSACPRRGALLCRNRGRRRRRDHRGERQVLRVRVDWSDVGLKCPLTGR